MIYYKCDDCNKDFHCEPSRTITGYTPPNDAGILIPDNFIVKHFCSKECIVSWMAKAINQEVYNGYRLPKFPPRDS